MHTHQETSLTFPIHVCVVEYIWPLLYVCVLWQSVLQDITSHQRQVDSVVEKAQGVLQSTSNSDVASFITNISSRYEKLASDAKVTLPVFAVYLLL